ncbi:ABC transporter ATP-binding protein [Actinokineospora diospyrosa]|uniref:Osmoprotectant transport system ATP-binding protein n=1 Tax=Actinokineospora diospyrosa TaxID=103728 RepID=A0ABT1I7K3_9PSEU|nr:ABC transporter ATP-binding protein [Actinokineospora diospyrosa]MCP2268602.1 osmoprotectant transport system ATP-binding protein [Actinokineospora diospyrosa]
MIEFQSVTKRYDDGTVAVDELDLTIDDGKITVLVGPSGCGKTTSLRMINRMVEASSGTILVDGADIRSQRPAALRRGIGYVIQNAGLFPHRTVLDNIATVPILLGTKKAAARRRAEELLDTVGLPRELAKRYPAQLSGGQQQRVGVARALAADPPVLLMDEPFSAVDPVVRDDLQEELLRLQSELGKTIVFVTHDIDEAIKLGDKVAVLRVGGKLAQYDTPATLLAKPVDDFVAGFVGRDRGYRALGFLSAHGVEVAPLSTLTLGEPAPVVTGWTVVVDERRRPLGWLSAKSTVEGEIRSADLVAGGSLYVADSTAAGSLRAALDSALSSPSGTGIAVDAEGAVVGGVTADSVLKVLDAARRSGEVPS